MWESNFRGFLRLRILNLHAYASRRTRVVVAKYGLAVVGDERAELGLEIGI